MSIPCKNCERREVGCHAWCEEYIEFKTGMEKYLEENYKKNDVDNYHIDGVIKKANWAKKRYKS